MNMIFRMAIERDIWVYRVPDYDYADDYNEEEEE